MKRSDTNKGVALLMVLWVLMLLTVIVGEFCFTMRTRVNITRNFKESTEDYYIAVAGVGQAITEIIKREILPPATVNVDSETEEDAASVWRNNTDIPPVPFGKGEYTVRIENESGKVNINKANQTLLKFLVGRFVEDESQRDVIVDSILDWRDSDRNHRLNGAEDDYYQSLPSPYECKDGDFDSIDELLLVRGVTPDIYFKGLAPLVTVYPKNSKKDLAHQLKNKDKTNEFDYNKLNINAMSEQMWASLPGMTEELVEDIKAYRVEKDFKAIGEVLTIVGPEIFNNIRWYLTTRTTPYYTIISTGNITGSSISNGVTAVIRLDNPITAKYQILKWVDEPDLQKRRNPVPASQ